MGLQVKFEVIYLWELKAKFVSDSSHLTYCFPLAVFLN